VVSSQAITVRSIDDLIAREYGVRIEVIEEASTLDADIAKKVMIIRNRRRIAALFINLSANKVFVAPFADVSTTRGIQIPSNGGSVSINFKDDLTLPAMEWSNCADVDNSAIYVLGVYIDTGEAGELAA